MQKNERQLLYEWFLQRPKALHTLKLLNTAFTAAVYAVYILLCLFLLVRLDPRLCRVVAVPFTVFATGSWLRAKINAPRPYENGGTPSLLKKETVGKSFPSRHVFCAAVITMACLWISLPLGIVMIFVALTVSVLRIIGGVHWPRDVLAGLAYGGLLGLFGFFFLP